MSAATGDSPHAEWASVAAVEQTTVEGPAPRSNAVVVLVVAPPPSSVVVAVVSGSGSVVVPALPVVPPDSGQPRDPLGSAGSYAAVCLRQSPG